MLWNIEGLNSNLTQDSEGYVYWKGAHVEHYSFRSDDLEREKEQALELVARCEHIESLGLSPNSGNAIWSWSWFEGLTREKLDSLPAMVSDCFVEHRGLYENAAGEICWLYSTKKVSEDKDDWASVGNFTVFGPAGMRSFDIASDNLGNFYHPLHAAGWISAQMGQPKDNGCCYATTDQVIAWFTSKGAM